VKNRVEKQVPAGKTNRFMELEGLRVIAAIIVVFYHAALIFYPGYFYGANGSNPLFAPVQNMRFEDNLYQNPLSALLSGTFAVGIFFVLSGFVLSVGYFKKRESSIIVRMASKRYLRLMLPALASVMVGWLFVSLGGAEIVKDAVGVTHSGWLAQLWRTPPDFFEALWQGLVAVFTIGQVHYNPVLWTIHHELLGSFVIFGTALVFASSRHRWIVYAGLIFVLANTWLLGFVLGMILADLYVNKEKFYEILNSKFTYVLILAGIVVGGFPSGPVTSPLYKALIIPGYNGTQQLSFYTAIGATAVVIGILALPGLKKLMSHKLVSGMGKYTYALYLIHMPILFTVCTSVFLVSLPIGFHKAALIAVIASWAVLLPATYLFEKYIDAPAIRFASYSADIFLGAKQLNTKKKMIALKRYVAKKTRVLRPRRNTETMPEIEVE